MNPSERFGGAMLIILSVITGGLVIVSHYKIKVVTDFIWEFSHQFGFICIMTMLGFFVVCGIFLIIFGGKK